MFIKSSQQAMMRNQIQAEYSRLADLLGQISPSAMATLKINPSVVAAQANHIWQVAQATQDMPLLTACLQEIQQARQQLGVAAAAPVGVGRRLSGFGDDDDVDGWDGVNDGSGDPTYQAMMQRRSRMQNALGQ